MLRRCALLAYLALSAAVRASAQDDATRAERPNIVLIVLDDVGIERIGAYCEHVEPDAQPPCTPNIDALAARGVLFSRAIANPICSPTRAQILTGRHAFRTGIGALIDYGGTSNGLSVAERILPEVLGGYDTSLVGKWHLGNRRLDGLQHPLASGFRSYSGSLFNLTAAPIELDAARCPPGRPFGYGYYHWVKAHDPASRGRLEETCCDTYATTDTTDDALARARAMRPPWFLEVAFNAAHSPFQLPPPELCPPDDACAFQAGVQRDGGKPEMSDAMLEALDHELGRLLAGIAAVDPEAYVVLISDNGTDTLTTRATAGGCFAPRRTKGSLYQGGIRVPLIVAGPGVVPGRCTALVGAVDLFATITELAGMQIGAEDSISLVPYLRGRREPLRAVAYAETFRPNFVPPPPGSPPSFAPVAHTRAVQDERFKLIRWTTEEGSTDAFFDLETDPCEQDDLASGPGLTPLQAAHRLALEEELTRLGVF